YSILIKSSPSISPPPLIFMLIETFVYPLISIGSAFINHSLLTKELFVFCALNTPLFTYIPLVAFLWEFHVAISGLPCPDIVLFAYVKSSSQIVSCAKEKLQENIKMKRKTKDLYRIELGISIAICILIKIHFAAQITF